LVNVAQNYIKYGWTQL